MAKKILIIEDDKDISDLIALYLRYSDFEVEQVYTGEEGLAKIYKAELSYACILLDLNLPGNVSGYEVLEKIRSISNVPIIICSALESDEDIIRGLKLGGDDFVTKPFSPKVLIERIKVNVNRYELSICDKDHLRKCYCFGDYKFYLDGLYLEKNGVKVRLANREVEVLKLLLDNAGRHLSVYEIYEAIWKEKFGDLATVAVHVQRIRKKIETDKEHYILTTYGAGYSFNKELIKRVGFFKV